MNASNHQALRGDPSRHLAFAELERSFQLLTPPNDAGKLMLIVARAADGQHHTLDRAVLDPSAGLPGDNWGRKSPEKTDSQISVMRADVARLFANGQPLHLFGDNLLIELDLSAANLPTGSRLRLGQALLEVTPMPHTGCVKFRQRFGEDAFRLTADTRYRDLHLRGIYLKVTQPGEVAVGDAVEVLSRGNSPTSNP
jgi:MOSC domain-containing protein YiiM